MPETNGPKPSQLTNSFGRVIGIGLVLLFIVALSYVLGNSILTGPLKGNDSPLHVAYATWLNDHFPRVPHWFPTQGGGESLLHGYPVASHLLLVVLHRATGLSILQAYRLVSFITFPVISFGLYLFCWGVFRKQTIGAIAAFFYLLAPVNWTWMYDWGFFSQQVALAFLPLALLAFLRTHDCQFDSTSKGRGRVWFVVLVILMLAAAVTHMLVATAAAIGMGLYTALFALLARGEGRAYAGRRGFKVLALLSIVLGLTAAGYLAPFYRYGQVANREGLNVPAVHELHRLLPLNFFGLQPIDPSEILTRMQFPAVLTALALIGAVLAWRWRGQRRTGLSPLILAIAGALAAVFALFPPLPALVLKHAPLLFNFLNFRSALLLVMFLLPALAGFGAWAAARVLILPRELFGSSALGASLQLAAASSGRAALTSLVAILIAIAGSTSLWLLTYDSSRPMIFGPLSDGLDPQDLWDRGDPELGHPLSEQLLPAQWPEWALQDHDPGISGSKAVAQFLPEQRPLRIDVSPYEGRLAMDLATYAGASQVNSYTFQISLIHAMWGYQQNVFFSRETGVSEYGSPQTLNSNAKWFGTSLVVLDPEKDPVEMYREAAWEQYATSEGFEIWRFPESPGLATVTARPTVLVIGKPETDAYMTIYRIANQGFLAYQDLLLVEGSPRVDDYELADLERFDAVLLYGHDYRNSEKAWELLGRYVEQGGGLFVDTGWEYWIPEWEFDPAPQVLPVIRARWTDYGATGDYVLSQDESTGQVDVSQFKPLVWEGKPWTLSGAEASEVKDWGKVVLSANGRPLIVSGEYGTGRVVWSGMNLLGHARYGDPTQEELELFGNLVKWAAGGADPQDLAHPVFSRRNPDEINFLVERSTTGSTWLYWREAFYPNWRAYVSDSTGRREVPIYRAGPGFMLMPVESQEADPIVQLRWEPPVVEQLAIVSSVFGSLLLVALAVDGLFLGGNGFARLKIALLLRIPQPFLGEGSNQDWAEHKRRQLAEGELHPATRKDQSLDAGSWATETEAHDNGADGGYGDRQGGSTTEVETEDDPSWPRATAEAELDPGSLAVDHEQLLASWLEHRARHIDRWAEGQLRKRRRRQ